VHHYISGRFPEKRSLMVAVVLVFTLSCMRSQPKRNVDDTVAALDHYKAGRCKYDSTEAVRIAYQLVSSTEESLRIGSVTAHNCSFIVTLLPIMSRGDTIAMFGGGARVQVLSDGTARILERFR